MIYCHVLCTCVARLSTTEMWLEETDGGINNRTKRLTQAGDSPPLASSLG